MEINGKKVLTLPMQVLQNQKDIYDLKMSTPYQRHKFSVKLEYGDNYQDAVLFDVYTTDDLITEDITLDYVKTYLTNNMIPCYGLVGYSPVKCLAYWLTYDGSHFKVSGLRLDLTDYDIVTEDFDLITAIKIQVRPQRTKRHDYWD